MSKLFVLGNGFDLDHKLPTSYEHFHQYLLKKDTDKALDLGIRF
ncbi:AbiH family protein [Bacillus cereus]|nr:AbiH family protein [Bacillus cereus]